MFILETYYHGDFHLLTLSEDLQHLNEMTTTLKKSTSVFNRPRNGGSVPFEGYMVQNFG